MSPYDYQTQEEFCFEKHSKVSRVKRKKELQEELRESAQEVDLTEKVAPTYPRYHARSDKFKDETVKEALDTLEDLFRGDTYISTLK